MESARPRRGVARYVLSSVQVLDIYRLKTQGDGLTKSKTSASSIAKIFGISSKTVRDIWNGRTWYRTTNHLEPNKGDAAKRMQRHAGRPKGSKDSKPRVRKQMLVKFEEAETATAIYSGNSFTGKISNNSPASSRTMPEHTFDFPMFTDDHRIEEHVSHTMFDKSVSNIAAAGTAFQSCRGFDFQIASCIDPFHDDWQDFLSRLRQRYP